ncbi:10291_t:CDS:2 [Funneliformis caledonium]|uniref:10291_t:CDS:1 n=1 Tax=Funneliformis caledonium TaxID=1117310 RepID=A0A9N9EHH3_9GLOM|nr:10291_t:CDS:2 [Funneliformis caledonium]
MLKSFLWIITTIFVSLFFDNAIAYNLIETTQNFNNIKQYINDDTLILIPPPTNDSANQFVTLLFQNGTSSVINIDVKSQNEGNALIDIYPLAKNYIWIIYARNVNESSSVQNMFGMLMNWNQEILAFDVDLNCPYDVNDRPTVATNINPEDGFIIITKNTDHHLTWNEFSYSYQAQPIYMVYLALIGTPQHSQVPALVYETSEDKITSINIQSCKVAFVDHANVCFLKSIVNSSLGVSLSATVEIAFLSTGSVIDISQLGLDNDTINLPALPTPNANNITDSVIPLENDGLLLIRHTDNSITGHIYDQYGNNIGKEWDIPKNLTENSNLLGFGMFKNNTAWIALDGLTDSIVSSDMPKFIEDSGYNNLLVVSTEPKINSLLFTPYPKTINITYSIPITQGSGNITIYQVNDNGSKLLRQTFPGASEHCRIDEIERKTISCKALNSTFNHMGTNYTVIVDNNFVKNSFLDEPLSGIQSGFWNFKTNASSAEIPFTVGFTVLLRLDDEGTRNFFADKKFLDHLHTELSQSIPVKHHRLVFTRRVQKDYSTENKRLLFEFKILEDGNATDPRPQDVFNSLKTLIKHKKITILSTLSHARYLDETYEIHIVPNLWEVVRYLFLGFVFVCLTLGSLYLWARYRHPKGKNSAIFKIPLLLFDLLMDILFVIYHGRTIPYIFIPSIIILAVSFAFNSFMSVIIITREISHNPNFQKWFDNHIKLAALFTVLGFADVETLYTLKSRIAGLESFSAPYSKVGLSWILNGSALNVLMVDLPQVIFQIIYLQTVLNYTLIPFFTLITSSLIFVIDLVSHVHDAMSNQCCKNSKVGYMFNDQVSHQSSRESSREPSREPSRELSRESNRNHENNHESDHESDHETNYENHGNNNGREEA